MSSLTDLIRNSTVSAGSGLAKTPAPGSTIVTLANAALETAALSQLPDPWLQDEPPTIIVVPSADWIEPMSVAIAARKGHVWTAGPDQKKPSERQAALRAQEGGGVWITHDRRLIPSVVKRTAERVVVIKQLISPAIVRAIMDATGEIVPIADTDWAGLDLAMVALAIQSDRTAEQCRARLRLWATGGGSGTAGPTLPLCGAAALWAQETVILLQEIKTGTLPSRLLRHTLLVGPPGSGKSGLVHHVARTAGVPVEMISVAALFASGSGHLDSVIRTLVGFFDRLRAHGGPIIGMIEEADALSSRGTGGDRNGAYWSTLVTAALLAIDDLNASGAPVLLVGCTNLPEAVDPALRRPGRIGRVVEVGPPQTIADLARVIRYHLGADLPDAPLSELCGAWLGETQAQLADRVTDARTRALIDRRDLALTDLVTEGYPPSPQMRLALHSIAVHEAAHAVLAHDLGRRIKAVQLLVDGASLVGVTRLVPRTSGATLEQRLDDIVIALAGRCADRLISGRLDDGASTDLIAASQALATLYMGTGLTETLLALPAEAIARRLSVDPNLQARVEATLQQQSDRADGLVELHRTLILALAEALVVGRSLDTAAIRAIIESQTP